MAKRILKSKTNVDQEARRTLRKINDVMYTMSKTICLRDRPNNVFLETYKKLREARDLMAKDYADQLREFIENELRYRP